MSIHLRGASEDFSPKLTARSLKVIIGKEAFTGGSRALDYLSLLAEVIGRGVFINVRLALDRLTPARRLIAKQHFWDNRTLARL